MKITKRSRHLVLFMAIGDGHIKNGCLHIRHSKEQKEYLEWKKKLLNKNGITTTPIVEIDNEVYTFRTYSHEFIRLYYRILYNKGKNISDIKILKKINPIGLAILYMDRGGLTFKKKNGRITGCYLTINTYLSKENNQIIIDYFRDEWNINFNQIKSGKFYKLRCGTKETEKFIDIVKPYLVEVSCMKHKLK